MIHDLYVTYQCENVNCVKEIVGNKDINIATRISLLAQALKDDSLKNIARTGDKKRGGGYKSLVYHETSDNTLYTTHLISEEKKRLEAFHLWQPNQPDNFATLPQYTTFLQFKFVLATPYISRDDEIFHINENPVRKDKVFKVPMMAASSWKGNLRWMTTHLMVLCWQEMKNVNTLAEERFHLALLFGDETGEGEDKKLSLYLDSFDAEAAAIYRKKTIEYFGCKEKQSIPNHAGRLYFYPTFFDKISLEVINPHNRETGAGSTHGPILMECVPIGTTGTFTVLYVPFDLIGKEEKVIREQVVSDLELLINGIQAMFTIYGFGAKTSSGFGTAEMENTGGSIVFKYPDVKEKKQKPIEPLEPESIQRFRQELPEEDFSLKPKEWGTKYSNSRKKSYIEARADYHNYKNELDTYQTQLKEWEEFEQAPALPIIQRTFTDWKQIDTVVDEISRTLKDGGTA